MSFFNDTQFRDYRTLEDIQARKQQLLRQIDHDTMQMKSLWHSVFTRREDTTQGQFIAGLLSNSAMIIDAFLMVRKLRRRYKSKA